MNSFSRQGKALPVEVRNIIVGKWLRNEGIASIANIIQHLIQYLVWYFSTLVLYFSTLVGTSVLNSPTCKFRFARSHAIFQIW